MSKRKLTQEQIDRIEDKICSITYKISLLKKKESELRKKLEERLKCY